LTDKPAATPPRPPLVLPPNCRDAAEKVGTIFGIVGATASRLGAPKDKPK
jgi:hypothetical protein